MDLNFDRFLIFVTIIFRCRRRESPSQPCPPVWRGRDGGAQAKIKQDKSETHKIYLNDPWYKNFDIAAIS